MPSILPLLPATVIQRNDSKFLASALGDEIVMMDMDSGDYLGINSIGSDIWNLLENPLTVHDLITKIMGIYDVTEAQCTAEVTTFLFKMQEQDMLIIK